MQTVSQAHRTRERIRGGARSVECSGVSGLAENEVVKLVKP